MNTAVALIFFTRPQQFKVVFECVRRAKPSRLYLIQDGPRNLKDKDGIYKCRQIADSVDWKCEIFKNYSENNLGCGMRIFTGLKWAFQTEDRLIILEDDCVPSDSFFPFCDEILEKYKDDERVAMISGMNHLGKHKEAYADYIFALVGSIAGWATWKRCWDVVDFEMKYIQDTQVQHNLDGIAKYGPKEHQIAANRWKQKLQSLERGERQKSWSYQYGITSILNSQLIIVPSKNLMTNIGAVKGGTNTPNDEKLVPKSIQRIYHLPLYEYNFPLKHPKFITIDYLYNKLVRQAMNPTGCRKFLMKMEVIWRRLRYGGVKAFCRSIIKKLAP